MNYEVDRLDNKIDATERSIRTDFETADNALHEEITNVDHNIRQDMTSRDDNLQQQITDVSKDLKQFVVDSSNMITKHINNISSNIHDVISDTSALIWGYIDNTSNAIVDYVKISDTSLKNYSDIEDNKLKLRIENVSSKLIDVSNALNRLIGTDDVTTAIDTFREIEEFLKAYSNKDSLSALLQTNSATDKAYADSILQRFKEYIEDYILDGSTDIINKIYNTSNDIVHFIQDV